MNSELNIEKFIEDNLEEILKLKSQGYTLTSICEKYNVKNSYEKLKYRFRKMGHGFNLKRKKFTEVETDDIVKRYLSGQSSCSISNQYGCTDDYILSTLRKEGIEIRTKQPIPEDILCRMISDYDSGLSIAKLSEKYNFTRKKITSHFRKRGVEIANGSDALLKCGLHKIDRNAFSDMTDEKSAYFYGWILSDGCLSNDGKYVSLEIHREDEYILHKLKEYLQTGATVGQYTHKDRRNGNVYFSSKLSFGDKVVIQRLKDLGLTSRKSLKEKCPEDLKFNRHFWRGYMDGDGSIYRGKNPRIEIHGGESIANSFKDYCEYLGVKASIGSQHNKNSIVYTCRVSGLERSKVVADKLYSDSSVYLPRKYQTYLDRYVNYVY